MFTVKDGEQIFLAAVSDTQWAIFCEAFGFGDLLADPRLATNNDRVQRARLDDAASCARTWPTTARPS